MDEPRENNEDGAAVGDATISQPSTSSSSSVPQHFLVELTSLDELTFPANSSKRLKYTCVASCSRSLVLGTSTGTVYVFSRYAARNRSRGASSIPVQVFTTRDGPVNTISISEGEEMMAIGGDSGRITVAQLHAADPPTLVYTVPGDARRPDKVTALAWSTDRKQIFSGHASGIVQVHRLGSRSVFRAAHEKLFNVDGEVVQLDVAGSHLLVAGSFAAFLYHLDNSTFQQVGKKSRSSASALGACFTQQSADSNACEYVVAARPNGRLWEANLVGVVYRTHQFRQSSCVPRAPPISFRNSFPTSNSEFEGIHPENQDVMFHVLHKISIDDKFLIVSAFGSRIVVIDADTSKIVVVAEIDAEIVNVSTCGNDIFILLGGGAGLRKFTLFDRTKAIEKLNLKSLFIQAAQVLLFCSTAAQFSIELLTKVCDGLSTLSRKKETERLQTSLSKLLQEAEEKKKNEQSMYDNLDEQKQRGNCNSIQAAVSQKLPTGVHKVLRGIQESGYEDDFTFSAPSALRERSRSSPGCCADEARAKCASPEGGLVKRASVPLTIVEAEETRKNGTPDVAEEDILNRARHILESDGRLMGKDSLRLLLQFEEVDRDEIRFTPTVTIGNAAKALAELAMTTPVDVDMMLENARKRNEVKRSDSGKQRAMIVKVVQPGIRPRAATVAPLATVEMNNSPTNDLDRTSEERKDTVNNDIHDERRSRQSTIVEEDIEERMRQDEMWLDLRLSQIARENARKEEESELKQSDTDYTLATETTASSQTVRDNDDVTPTGGDEDENMIRCVECGMHRSWAALSMLSAVCSRVTVITDNFISGGVPANIEEWTSLLSKVANRKRKPDIDAICPRCETALNEAKKSLADYTRGFGLAPDNTVPNVDKIHERCVNISVERMRAILTGTVDENTTVSPTTMRDAIGKVAEDVVTSDEEETVDVVEEEWKWLNAVHLKTLLLLACASQGFKNVLEIVSSKRNEIASKMNDADWTTLVAACAKEQAKRRNPITVTAMKKVLESVNASDWFEIEDVVPKKPVPQIRPTMSSLNRPQPMSAMHSWIVDASVKCPICTLPVKTVVGGKDSGVCAFVCGHVYHVICSLGRTGCVACRVRARRSVRGSPRAQH